MRQIFVITLLLILCVTVVPLTGCQSTTRINQIAHNALYYDGKEVTIIGTAGGTENIPALNKVGYNLDDGSGSIFVFTEQKPPEKGTQITVKGTISSECKNGK